MISTKLATQDWNIYDTLPPVITRLICMCHGAPSSVQKWQVCSLAQSRTEILTRKQPHSNAERYLESYAENFWLSLLLIQAKWEPPTYARAPSLCQDAPWRGDRDWVRDDDVMTTFWQGSIAKNRMCGTWNNRSFRGEELGSIDLPVLVPEQCY